MFGHIWVRSSSEFVGRPGALCGQGIHVHDLPQYNLQDDFKLSGQQVMRPLDFAGNRRLAVRIVASHLPFGGANTRELRRNRNFLGVRLGVLPRSGDSRK